MRTAQLATALTGLLASAAAQSSTEPGYDAYPNYIPSTIPSNETLSFGQHYAVLNLDLINGLVAPIANTTEGEAFISCTSKWINAVAALTPKPLTFFSRIYFSNSHNPEISDSTPFKNVGGSLGTASSNATMIYPAFHVNETAGDVVIQKTRYYAGAGNGLEEILRAQRIDTVVLSGIRTSGVIISTAYRLFDLDYKVYVIANNTIETPSDKPAINTNILEGILPKVPINVITIEQAMAALNASGPAIY
ncbi:hypothetical protein LTR62_005866 [Meristemomyces frigidus]|uniref:Isochorismatase-like domain-containing protein n=1 Tax=Meristemomyces frigidus TaxID=1508187 RepID=A0AAN7TQH4_9PEZI|nr:hypothetical protein LTR62_005866 [Meristemomyces frigidus]